MSKDSSSDDQVERTTSSVKPPTSVYIQNRKPIEPNTAHKKEKD